MNKLEKKKSQNSKEFLISNISTKALNTKELTIASNESDPILSTKVAVTESHRSEHLQNLIKVEENLEKIIK